MPCRGSTRFVLSGVAGFIIAAPQVTAAPALLAASSVYFGAGVWGSAEERCAHFPDSPAPAPPISAHRKRPAARDGRPRHITLRMTEMDNAVELAAPMAKAEVGGSHDDASVSLEVSEIIE